MVDPSKLIDSDTGMQVFIVPMAVHDLADWHGDTRTFWAVVTEWGKKITVANEETGEEFEADPAEVYAEIKTDYYRRLK